MRLLLSFLVYRYRCNRNAIDDIRRDVATTETADSLA
jgi:hypothetical protein